VIVIGQMPSHPLGINQFGQQRYPELAQYGLDQSSKTTSQFGSIHTTTTRIRIATTGTTVVKSHNVTTDFETHFG